MKLRLKFKIEIKPRAALLLTKTFSKCDSNKTWDQIKENEGKKWYYIRNDK